METVLLIVHLFIAAGLVGLVLLQRSEGGALGMGGGSGSLISGRGAADVLGKLTMAAGLLFLTTSISLSLLAGWQQKQLENSIVLDRPAITRPATAPAAAPPVTPTETAVAPTALDAPPGVEGVAPAPVEAVERAGPVERAAPQAAPPVRQAAAPAATRPAPAATTSAAPPARTASTPATPPRPRPQPAATAPPESSIPAPLPELRQRAGPDQ